MLSNGVDEIDMVINIGALKSKILTLLREDIQAVVDASGDRLVKVIIETCLLTEVSEAVSCLPNWQERTLSKLSLVRRATVEDVALMRQVVGPGYGSESIWRYS